MNHTLPTRPLISTLLYATLAIAGLSETANGEETGLTRSKAEHWEVHAHHAMTQKGSADTTASASGSWFDAGNWSDGQVPSAGNARLLPAGITLPLIHL